MTTRSKVFSVCIIICLAGLSLSAQDKSDRYHNFGSEKRWQIKAYFGPLIAFSNVENSFSIDLGATGGIFIKKKFYMGFYGQKLINGPPRNDLASIGYPTFTDGKIDMIHAGGILGYIHKPAEVIHWGASGSAGLGILYLYAQDPVNQSVEKLYDDRIYIAIPKLFIEMNMTGWLKVNVSAGYRVVGKVNGVYTNLAGETTPTFNKSDYTKPEFSMTILFGTYDFGRSLLD